jgi:regulator of PEP synthase PpsR (kinase-PPPase family)
VGVSRASKSVTCFYLAYRGIRAANVPLVPGIEPPAELLEVSPEKVVGLMMNPHRLQSIRESRRGAIRAANLEKYSDLRHVAKELRQAQALIDKHGWQCIDVSYMAVEEVAAEIIEMVVKRAA